MIYWHGYEQGQDAYVERPWWRRATSLTWRRTDGWMVTEQPSVFGWTCLLWHEATGQSVGVRVSQVLSKALAQVDTEHPLPDPEPRLRQVWVWLASGCSRELIAIEPDGTLVFSGLSPGRLVDGNGKPVYPPRPAVLVAGPGSPWAPAPRSEGSDAD